MPKEAQGPSMESIFPLCGLWPQGPTPLWYSEGMATRTQRKNTNPGTGPQGAMEPEGPKVTRGTLASGLKGPKGRLKGDPWPHRHPERSWGLNPLGPKVTRVPWNIPGSFLVHASPVWVEIGGRKGLHGHTGARMACMATQ